MKQVKALMKIECFVKGKWEPVQDARQLEPGDIIRMFDEKGLSVLIAGKSLAAVDTPAGFKNRMLKPKEYEQVLNTVAVPEKSPEAPVTQA